MNDRERTGVLMFDKRHASSAVKKTAYTKGFKKRWLWEPIPAQYPDQPFIRLKNDKGETDTITQVEAEHFQDYTWKELREKF